MIPPSGDGGRVEDKNFPWRRHPRQWKHPVFPIIPPFRPATRRRSHPFAEVSLTDFWRGGQSAAGGVSVPNGGRAQGPAREDTRPTDYAALTVLMLALFFWTKPPPRPKVNFMNQDRLQTKPCINC